MKNEKTKDLIKNFGPAFVLLVVVITTFILGLPSDNYTEKETKREVIVDIRKSEGFFEISYQKEGENFITVDNLRSNSERVIVKESEEDYDYFVRIEREYENPLTRFWRNFALSSYKETLPVHIIYLKEK